MNKEEKLKRAKEFLQLLDKEHLSRDEFLQAIQTLTKQIKDLEGQLIKNVSDQTKTEKQELNNLKQNFNKVIQKSKKESDNTFSGFRRKLLEGINAIYTRKQIDQKINTKINEIDQRLFSIRDGIDGINGRDGKDADPAESAQVTYEIIREKQTKTINKLQKQIDKLEKKIKKLKKPEVVYTGGGGAAGGGHVKAYDLSSSLDGSTKTFSLPAFWRVISVHTSSFPNALRGTTDYTTDASAMTISFTSEIDASTTLASGQTVVIVYATP